MPAASQLYEVIPRHTMFQIGRNLLPSQANDPLVGIVKREGVLERLGGDPAGLVTNVPTNMVLFCCVRNLGTAAFTLDVDQSSNNNSDGLDPDNADTGPLTPDAYVAAPLRVDGATVAGGTVTVVPGGAVVFMVEWDAAIEDYLKFQVAEEAAFGELALAHYNGTLVPRAREGVI